LTTRSLRSLKNTKGTKKGKKALAALMGAKFLKSLIRRRQGYDGAVK